MRLSLQSGGVVACVLLSLLACGEPGRVRVSDEELFGTYTTDIDVVTNGPVVNHIGKEQLTLRPNKTYVQVFSSPEKTFTNTGHWKSSNLFLSGTQVELLSFNTAEYGAPEMPPHYEPLDLFVHKEQGRLVLARSEKREWYYNRVQ